MVKMISLLYLKRRIAIHLYDYACVLRLVPKQDNCA